MVPLTPLQDSALRELAEVTDLVRGYLSTTEAAPPADRLWSLVTSRPLPSAATFDDVGRTASELRDVLGRLSEESVPLPASVKFSRALVANQGKDLEGASEKLTRALGRAPATP